MSWDMNIASAQKENATHRRHHANHPATAAIAGHTTHAVPMKSRTCAATTAGFHSAEMTHRCTASSTV
jgi:hypothetical protein